MQRLSCSIGAWLSLLVVMSTPMACVGNGLPDVAAPEMKQFEPGQLVAVINEEYVLAGDLLVLIEHQLQDFKNRVSEEQMVEIREKMMRQALAQIVQS